MSDRSVAWTEPAAGDHADQVRALFDTKASGWPAKYAPGGPLAGRLIRLDAAVRDLAAAGGAVLDLGCGSGELARRLAAGGYRVIGGDIAPAMLRQAAAADRARAVRWIRLEPGWQELPLAAGCLDAVVAASVLEYVREPGVVLAECARVLKPGGIVVCTVPNVIHPVRWLERPLRLAARTALAANALAAVAPRRGGPYLAYLRASCQRRRLRWWQQAARRAGLEPRPAPRASYEPLRLLIFTRAAARPGTSLPQRPGTSSTQRTGER